MASGTGVKEGPQAPGKERMVVAFTENGKLGTGEKWRRKYTVINFLLWEAEGSQRLSLAAGAQARDLSQLDCISELFQAGESGPVLKRGLRK